MKTLLPFLLCLFSVQMARADIAWIPNEKRFADSDIVVVAKVLSVETTKPSEKSMIEYATLAIQVEQDLKPLKFPPRDRYDGDKLTLVCQTKFDWPCPEWVEYKPGETLVLFLKRTNIDGLYHLDTNLLGKTEVTPEIIAELRKLAEVQP